MSRSSQEQQSMRAIRSSINTIITRTDKQISEQQKDKLKRYCNIDLGMGETPLIVASRNGRKDIVQFLIAIRADLNKRSALSGMTALHTAYKYNREIAQMLMKSGADLNAVDGEGRTLLHYAASIGDGKMVSNLLQHGARPDIRDRLGETAASAAFANDHKKIMQNLVDAINNRTIKPEQYQSMRSKLLDAIEMAPVALRDEMENMMKDLTCPISHEIFQHPVIAADGHTYEESEIKKWFKVRKRKSPVTNLVLPNEILIPNLKIRNMIFNLGIVLPAILSTFRSGGAAVTPRQQRALSTQVPSSGGAAAPQQDASSSTRSRSSSGQGRRLLLAPSRRSSGCAVS